MCTEGEAVHEDSLGDGEAQYNQQNYQTHHEPILYTEVGIDKLNMQPIVVFTTVPDAGTAAKLAKQIVDSRLAACVQVSTDVASTFWWNGQLVTESERVLTIKTFESQWEAIEKMIAAAHPYSVPELVAVPISRVTMPYLDWMKKEVSYG
jgi:periplasmic divalent cation tolerance protein